MEFYQEHFNHLNSHIISEKNDFFSGWDSIKIYCADRRVLKLTVRLGELKFIVGDRRVLKLTVWI